MKASKPAGTALFSSGVPASHLLAAKLRSPARDQQHEASASIQHGRPPGLGPRGCVVLSPWCAVSETSNQVPTTVTLWLSWTLAGELAVCPAADGARDRQIAANAKPTRVIFFTKVTPSGESEPIEESHAVGISQCQTAKAARWVVGQRDSGRMRALAGVTGGLKVGHYWGRGGGRFAWLGDSKVETRAVATRRGGEGSC